jgi:1-acyl-sn-glycerol-3-phosphate acyltransferase
MTVGIPEAVGAAGQTAARPSVWRRAYLLGRVILAGLAFLGFGLGGVPLALLILPLVRWRHRRATPAARAAACQRWVQRSFTLLHDYMRICGLLHFDPRRADARAPGPRFVIVANHPTLVDVTALASVYGRMICVAKTPIFRAPVIGAIVRACGYIDGGSGDVLAGAAVVTQALERLSADIPVAIFPEGTRSPPAGLHPFKRGAFEIACRAGVPVLPIFVRCEPAALGKGRPWYDIPPRTAAFSLTPLPVMHPDQFGGSAARMASAAEAAFRQQLNL